MNVCSDFPLPPSQAQGAGGDPTCTLPAFQVRIEPNGDPVEDTLSPGGGISSPVVWLPLELAATLLKEQSKMDGWR
ncbi:MAG: hypothetical protein KJ063_14605 [Anaerolineae bacterium]|nr:hypothetical protein [Anaerolineae bacterium]